MCKSILILLPISFLMACGGQEKGDDLSIDLSHQETEPIEVKEDSSEVFIEEEEFIEGPFDLADFPTKWIHLTQSEEAPEEMWIQHYCDAETAYLELEAGKGEEYEFYVGYGQDGEQYYLTNFEAESLEMELYQCVSGSFDLESFYNEAITHVTFVWNQDLKFCSFDGLSFETPFFVNEGDRDYYEEIEEDCEGFWE